MKLGILLAIVVASSSCAVETGPSEVNPLSAPPVDAALGVSSREVLEWGYRRELRADLDGDGSAERLILAADVSVNDRGVPLWEDGHRWALVVQEGGADTLVFSSFVPNGFVEVAVLSASSEGGRELLIQERIPSQVRSLVVSYQQPGAARTVSSAYYQIEQWMPGSARLME
ncbi:MAG TPA: hypothetical protein VE685_23950 [Thermoanaerobaculia bacterium]|nr:hypothetical protein [Thermoanaerobaculia bacterium]